MNHEPALNPTRRRLLSLCRLDRTWAEGDGAWLVEGSGRRFLDGYAQYGAVALGHGHPAVSGAIRAALDEGVPPLVQPYRSPAVEALADALVRLAPPGLSRCAFTTSGAEAVEAAIQLARSATGRPVVLSAEGSFHGKTLGALAATGQPHHAEGLGPLPPGFERIPFGDAGALEARLASGPADVAAVLLEPIQGEGGVRIPPAGWLARVREVTRRRGVLLILDEIQTGLGRTGPLFACQAEDVSPDVLLLGKGLGGGVFPLGAVLATEAAWTDRFGIGRSSTFGENGLACLVGKAVLETLVQGGVAAGVEAKGRRLRDGLEATRRRHPRLVADVRGRGLLAAIELAPLAASEGTFFTILESHGLVAWAVAAWIAEEAGVLVLPTLGAAPVLRIAPPLVITDNEIDRLVAGLEAALAKLDADPTRRLAAFLCAERPSVRDVEFLPPPRPAPPRPAAGRYAFVFHTSGPGDAAVTNPGLRRVPHEELERVSRFIAKLPPVQLLEAPPVRSATGAVAEGSLIVVPWTPAELRRRGAAAAEAAALAAVDLGAYLGAEVVGLGGHTTPATRRGVAAQGRGPVVTTGNSLTAGMAIEAVARAASATGLDLRNARAAIVGAGGSVAGLTAFLLARLGVGELVLVGNGHARSARLQPFAERLAGAGARAIVSPDLSPIPTCRIVISATTSTAEVLGEARFSPGTILCDLAVPPDAPPELRARSDLVVVDGGLVALPDPATTFGPGNMFGLPPGIQLACLSETILLALSRERVDRGIGDPAGLDDVDHVMALARRHGFRSARSAASPIGLAS